MISSLGKYDWANPEFGWLIYAVAGALAWGGMKAAWGQRQALGLAPGEKLPWTWVGLAAPLPRLLRAAGLALLVLALMRPQTVNLQSESSVQSIDIFLAVDVSGSMQAEDAKPNRLEAAKAALKGFLEGVKGDRVGLVVFSGKAFVQCPLSLDHQVVKWFIDQVRFGTVNLDGTAVGDGLLLAVQRLIQEPRRGQVVVLATDGRSNTGQNPVQAAQIAASAGIKVYTIGIGQKGGATVKQKDFFGREQVYRMEEPDEATMTAMAQATGGRYFRATDEKSLAAVYHQIAQLEKREVKVKNRREADEHFYPFLLWGAALLLAEALLRLRLRMVL